jgi:hypothetical protein
MKNKIFFSLLGLSLILLFLFYSPILERAGGFLAPEEIGEVEVVIREGSRAIDKDVLIVGLHLMAKVKATRLVIVSHENNSKFPFRRSKLEALLSQELAVLGYKDDQIQVLDVPSEHPITLTEANLVLSQLSKEGIKRVLLVCDGFHTRRSYWAYRQLGMALGIKIFPYPYFNKYQKQPWWEHKRGIRSFITESVKFLYYIFKGYIPLKSLLDP